MKAKHLVIGLSLLITTAISHSAMAKRILVYGDSLSAGYGINPEVGWVALLAEHLGDQHEVLNGSISGETSAGGLARLPLTLEQLQPELVLLELGANDGLRGLPVSRLEANLNAMVTQLSKAGVETVIVGISVPPSYGPRYVDQFRAVFPKVAENNDLPFIDLYLEEFFLEPGFIQQDGLHPTEQAQPIVADLLLDFLQTQELLD